MDAKKVVLSGAGSPMTMFTKLYNMSWTHRLLLSSVFALATALAAMVKIFLPWTPIPITLQTFVVLAAGIMLGRWWGALSQVLYVGSGAAGLPIFAGMAGGIGSLVGPTGGYLVGFIVTAFVVGVVCEKQRSRGFAFVPTFLSLTAIYIVLIYGVGVAHLGWWTSQVQGSWPSIGSLLMLGVVPFLVGDAIKLVLATLLVKNSR